MIERNGWLAQPPMDKAEALSTPVRYVIICKFNHFSPLYLPRPLNLQIIIYRSHGDGKWSDAGGKCSTNPQYPDISHRVAELGRYRVQFPNRFRWTRLRRARLGLGWRAHVRVE